MKAIPKVFTVHVNKTNIRRGRKGDANSCAITKAIAREIMAKRRGIEVEVGAGDNIEITENGITRNYTCWNERVARRVTKFINDFDNKKSLVKPTKFRIRYVYDI